MTLNDTAWTDNGDNTATNLIPELLAGESVDLEITVTVIDSGSLQNNAEISRSTPAFGGESLGLSITDIDSTPGDGDPDQDDMDGAEVTVEAPPEPAPPVLAFTGLSSLWLLSLATLLLTSGGFIVVLRGREEEFDC